MSSGLVLEAEGGRWKQYPAYRDSGVGWLGAVPENWQVERLRFHISINPTKSEVRRLAPDTTVSFIPMEAVGEYGGICLDQTRPIEDVSAGYTYFQEGDVVVAKITPCFENVKRAVVTGLTNGIGFGTTELHVLRPNYNINRYFLFYLTLSYDFRKLGESEMYGSAGQKRVPEEFIKNLKHPIPSLSEQHAIAAFLDRETGRIDALIAKKERQIGLLQEKRTALISHAVTNGLDPDAPLKDSGVKWLGAVPEHWVTWKVTHGFQRLGSGTTPKSDDLQYYNGKIPWVTTSELRETVITDTNSKLTGKALKDYSSLHIYPPETLLFAMYGATIGRMGILDIYATVNQACCAFTDSKFLDPKFTFYWLWMRRPILITLSVGGGQPNLSQDDLRNIRIPAPTLPEQHAIATFLDHETGHIDVLTTKVHESIAKLREYRTALISAAVTGKIDVREELVS